MPLISAAQTDIGLVRSENEDRFLSADDLHLYSVADGIGGLPGGAEAAQLAITSLQKAARTAHEAGLPLDLSRAFQFANSEVITFGRRFAPDTGLGTTLTAALFREEAMRVASIGDTRCYLYREGRLRLLTIDDTVEHEVAVRRARGENVELEERYRNALTRCIGQPMPLDVRVSVFPIQPADRVLICSDGISRMITDAQIARRLAHPDAPAAVLGALIADALARGGGDNATGIVVDVQAE
jgi:serine/threonine protein phosphatase PrpC